MEQRREFLEAASRGTHNFAELCRRYGISRKNGYTWFNRYRFELSFPNRELTFADHHWYTARDIGSIQAAAREANAALIITTEKDAVRCDLECAVLPMTVEVDPTVEFEQWLMTRLRRSA